MKPLKAYLNFLSYSLNRVRGVPTVDHYPVMAFVDPTLYCNLGCPACPTGARAGLRPRATLSWDLYRAFLDEVGDYLFKLYLYNLGEPLLHKQTPELISYAKARDIFVMISTNLSLELSDDYLQRLVTSGLDVLVVALDGATAQTYQHYRRGGDFELVRANLKRLQALKQSLGSPTPRLVWQFLVFEHNQHEVETMRQQYKAWGADDYCVGGAYMPVGQLAEGFGPAHTAGFDIYDAGHLHRQKSVQALLHPKPCSWLYGVAVLNANGMVSPCAYTAAEKDDFGQYAPEHGFGAVWNSEKFVRARQVGTDWLADQSWESVAHRMDGRAMGVSAALEAGQLLCQRCPVPFLQDVVDHELSFQPGELVAYVERNYQLTEQERALLSSLTAALQAEGA